MTLLIEEWNEKQPYHDVFAAALLLEILTLWNREIDAGNISSGKRKLVEIMKRYIEDHYRSKITKDHVGCCVRKSPNYAASLFRSVTGQTISEYVHSIRIKTAIGLLQESELTLEEISEFLGYSDVSYFHKVFRRMTGKKPSEYRS
jgi:AraC family transcriptional regulator of arabinose operon